MRPGLCVTCRYFREYARVDERRREAIGYCHRYPRIHVFGTKRRCFYPEVNSETDWCGEWKPDDDPGTEQQDQSTTVEPTNQKTRYASINE